MPAIREFNYTNTDYQAIADLFKIVTGNNHYRPEGIQHMDKIRGPEIPFARFVAEEAGQVIAEASYSQSIWFRSANKLNLHIIIHPDVSSDDLGQAIYFHLLEKASPHNPQALTVRLNEDDPESIRFWKNHGFQQTNREPRFALDLIKFDPTKFDTIVPDMENQGIKLRTLAKVKITDPDWLHKWWQMEWLILQDLVTEEESAVRRTIEQFEQDIQHPAIIPEAFFFAIAGEQYTAITGLTRYDDVTYMSDLTWAIPKYQNLGIELAIKLKALKWAKDMGATYVVDEVIEEDPVYQINLQLGFEHLPAWLIFEKQL